MDSSPAAPQPLLSADDVDGLEAFLRNRQWLAVDEHLSAVARAGEGNMNLSLRVTAGSRSVIVKQGRPWVEKYPAIAAPADRTLIEAAWYDIARRNAAVAERIPDLLGVDPDAKVLMLTDLGTAGDYLHLYGGGHLREHELDSLVDWLAELHLGFRGDREAAGLRNRDMRVLNHEHIFEVPFRPDNGLELDAITPGLLAVAAKLRTDRPLLDGIQKLGSRYLTDGGTLLHGDYYPGSWLQADAPWIIDPEFGFYGPPEFDVGVMLAHLRLAGQSTDLPDRATRRYLSRAGELNIPLADGFAGAETIRRLLGVSQLPLTFGLDRKTELIDDARQLVMAVRE